MGITGLIPFMENASRQVNISQFNGCCVAIDAYCWLHKGAYTCADKLARGEHSDAYVHYCMKYVNMLLSHNIKPILVFDGRHLPAKAETEKKRRESREVNRKRAAELLRAGQSSEAYNFLRRCVDVTHAMALNLIQECRRRNVDCIVGPYEADAQLAYLNIKNIAQIVITEDSDLVLFGCTKILFKMDLYGNGKLVETDRLHLAMKVSPQNFHLDKFRYMCILSGCDYLPSLPGVGLVKACKFISRSNNPDIHKSLTRLPTFLNMRHLHVSVEYRDQFLRADATFRYQLVYDPIARCQTTLMPTPPNHKPAAYTGRPMQEDQAYQLALGNLDPFTLEIMDTYDPDKPQAKNEGGKTTAWQQCPRAKHLSIWSKGYTIQPSSPPPDPCKVERPSTRGKEVIVKTPVKIKSPPSLNARELVSLYGASPPAKRMRLTDDDIATELLETSPVKQDVKSPIIGSRNPFKKKNTEVAVSPTKTLFNELPAKKSENENSALAKFSRLRYKSGDKSALFQSRYFNGSESTPGPLDSSITSTEKLTDISNNSELKSPSKTPSTSNSTSYNNNTSPMKHKCYILDNDAYQGEIELASPVKTSSVKRSPLKLLARSLDFDKESKRSVSLEGWKSSKSSTFRWGSLRDRFGITGAKSDDTLIKSTAAAARSFKTPIKEEVSLKSLEEDEQIDEQSLLDSDIHSQIDSQEVLKIPGNKMKCFQNLSFEQQSLLDEEEVDEPSMFNKSSFDIITTPDDDDAAVIPDEGFCSLTPPTKQATVRVQSCRQFGLSKSKTKNTKNGEKNNLKQPSILSMFAYQAKSLPKIKRAP